MSERTLDEFSMLSTPIDVEVPAVIDWWCEHLDVAADELLTAVQRVGSMPAAIACYFRIRSAPRKIVSAADRARRQVNDLGREAAKKHRGTT